MKFSPRNVFVVFGWVLVWRVLLLVFTAQPIPANDAFGYDGAVVNWLHGGGYRNPAYALVFPISGKQLYSMYPPLYQVVLLGWMKLFGTSVISAMALHLFLFAVAGGIVLGIVRKFFPAVSGLALAALLFFGFTFVDRPESLAYVSGLGALWLTARQIGEPGFRPGMAAGLMLLLWLTLYTSVIVGAYFFGTGFLACAAACGWRRAWHWFVPFAGAAIGFVLVTAAIARLEPLWWAGFMESARQQSVMSTGFHVPHGADVIKMLRTTPVFVVALAVMPLALVRRKELPESPWVALCAGIFVMGWGLIAICLLLLPTNYIMYAMFTQILLAAGLLAWVEQYLPGRGGGLRLALAGCALLVSVRAAGMSTWGVACAWKNGYGHTQAVLREELRPFATSGQPVLVSSAYLYQAVDLGVKNPVHCDWYFDHTTWTNGAQVAALERLRPPKLVLTQFDYYRGFVEPLEQLRQHPETVEIRVRDQAAVRVPDASPSLQRVVQHISWAPVMVDLNWKAER